MNLTNCTYLTIYYTSQPEARVRANTVTTSKTQIVYDGQIVGVSKDITGILVEFRNGSTKSYSRSQF